MVDLYGNGTWISNNELPSFSSIRWKLTKFCLFQYFVAPSLVVKAGYTHTHIKARKTATATANTTTTTAAVAAAIEQQLYLLLLLNFNQFSSLLSSSSCRHCSIFFHHVLNSWVYRPARVISHKKVTVYVLKSKKLKAWVFLSISPLLSTQILSTHVEQRVILHSKLTIYVLKMWVL